MAKTLPELKEIARKLGHDICVDGMWFDDLFMPGPFIYSYNEATGTIFHKGKPIPGTHTHEGFLVYIKRYLQHELAKYPNL